MKNKRFERCYGVLSNFGKEFSVGDLTVCFVKWLHSESFVFQERAER